MLFLLRCRLGFLHEKLALTSKYNPYAVQNYHLKNQQKL